MKDEKKPKRERRRRKLWWDTYLEVFEKRKEKLDELGYHPDKIFFTDKPERRIAVILALAGISPGLGMDPEQLLDHMHKNKEKVETFRGKFGFDPFVSAVKKTDEYLDDREWEERVRQLTEEMKSGVYVHHMLFGRKPVNVPYDEKTAKELAERIMEYANQLVRKKGIGPYYSHVAEVLQRVLGEKK